MNPWEACQGAYERGHTRCVKFYRSVRMIASLEAGLLQSLTLHAIHFENKSTTTKITYYLNIFGMCFFRTYESALS